MQGALLPGFASWPEVSMSVLDYLLEGMSLDEATAALAESSRALETDLCTE
jgi:hypothetical protein